MKHKQQILITLLIVLILAGLTALAVNKYQHRPVVHTETLSQAQAERDAAVKKLVVVQAVDKANEDSLNQTKADLEAKLTSVCNSLKLTKVTNPACK